MRACVRSPGLLILVCLIACRKKEPPEAQLVPGQDTTPAPPVTLWTFEDGNGPPCLWRRISTGDAPGMPEVASFPARCDDVDLAWSGNSAIAWLSSRDADHLFAVTIGAASATPTPLPKPPTGAIRAVGFDDVPLVFTNLVPADDNNVTVWAWESGAWKERERGGHGLRELAAWKTQRGQSARKRREVVGAKPMDPAEVATFDKVASEDRAIADITEGIDEALATGNTVPVDGGVLVVMKKPVARWWELDIAGSRIALRNRGDQFIADLRRYANGEWRHGPVPTAARDRNEFYRVGIEVQGQMFLLSSDGRGPVLVDAKTGLTSWGNREFALAVFAP